MTYTTDKTYLPYSSSQLLYEFRSCHSERSEESLANASLKQVLQSNYFVEQRSFVVSLLRMTGSAKLVYLLDRQLQALKEAFIKEGGFTENLFKARLKRRESDQ